ncbi:radical SAM protein [Candidatus Aerophobetes bacterium]|nr:radical SAM protein [Candidatus Aerophobetes bacterium]
MSPAFVTLVNTNAMKPPISPIGFDYLASSLEKEGFEVDILDLCFSANLAQDIESYFKKNQPRAIGITLRNTDDCFYVSGDFFLPGLKKIKREIQRKTDSPLIIGGSGFSVMPQSVLSYLDVNMGMRGDCEQAFPLLLRKLTKKESIENVPGLIYKDKVGRLISNTPDSFEVGNLPLQTRQYVDNKRYFEQGGMGNIETKRGCNQQCIYCADPLIKGKKIRLRPPEHVVWELKKLLAKGIDHIHFCDSEFNLPPDHAERICEHIIKENLHTKLRWYTYCSPSAFSNKLAALMQRAGCAGINFGVDSGSDTILQVLGRNFDLREIKQTAEICHRNGIVFMYDLLLGGPGESKQTLKTTIELMKNIAPHRVGVTVGIRVYPGTSLSCSILKQGLLNKNPNLQVKDSQEFSDDFFYPAFYLCSEVSEEIFPYLETLIGDDERFFFPSKLRKSKNYNYNENALLMEAIKKGYRGAYWDILRKLEEEI